MAAKKQTNEELLAQFDDLGEEQAQSKPAAAQKTSESKSSAAAAGAPDENDPLAELENLAQERPRSRPHTPKAGADSKAAASASRKSQESGRPFHQAQTPSNNDNNDEEGKVAGTEKIKAKEEEASVPAPTSPSIGGGGGWFGGWGGIGGIVATAQSAVKQAEALAKEIQRNEEAQRWAEQVKGNVGALRSYGGELRSRALPTFTNILHTLAPPISSHERLEIHTTHDLEGYPSLDPLVYQTFSRVMAQVEGGELVVTQRARNNGGRRRSDSAEGGNSSSSAAGWSDGPWWRNASEKRDLGSVRGLAEGTKLCRVSAEQFAEDYFGGRGGTDKVKADRQRQQQQGSSEAPASESSNPTRSSDIFLAIQPLAYEDAKKELFSASSSSATAEEKEKEKDGSVVDPDEAPEQLLAFAVYLHDPLHDIAFGSVSQALPQKWVGWLDNLAAAPPDAGDVFSLPEEIRAIVESGGVDPREWVSEWVEEALGLAVGVVAQRYVARRMGVGEIGGGVGGSGGVVKGKAREADVLAGAGEAARAM